MCSSDLVGLIDADLVLVGILGDFGAYFTDQPLFKQVPAVAEGRAVVTEGDEAQDFTGVLLAPASWASSGHWILLKTLPIRH